MNSENVQLQPRIIVEHNFFKAYKSGLLKYVFSNI